MNGKDSKGNETQQQNRIYSANGIMVALSADEQGRHNIAIPCGFTDMTIGGYRRSRQIPRVSSEIQQRNNKQEGGGIRCGN